MLGKAPNKIESGLISTNWLKKIFNKLPDDAMEEVICLYARAFIMRLIGGILMPNKSRNLVHIRWPLHLMDFSEWAKLNWESAMLSTLYRELYRAAQSN
ncbi:hypothetical protein J1N35_018726 [Gossypium stocksii]|uniref:Aminotransferase-like plant mobile domain-containing protein n=1 Tax=Gossypium stocksii TaxID=47602 RepID=A0A9D3VPM6_9ROSI|nr:hypothetical protein J1N35_018726 [Gossypium stocksii]